MATSGVYTFSVNSTDIIREAMLNIGKLGEAENPTSQEFTDCLRKLNMLAKQWMAKQDFAPGLKMWKRRHGDLFLSTTTGKYNLGFTGDHWTNTSFLAFTTATALAGATSISVPNANITVGDQVGIVLDSGVLYWTTVSTKVSTTGITIPVSGLPTQASSGSEVFNYTTQAQRPEIIETVVLRDSTYSDIPMKAITLQDYDMLSYKVQPGAQSDPTYYYYEAQLTNGVLYLDVPGAADTSKHLHISYMEPVQDFVNTTDTPDYPQRWYMALTWGLTKQIAPMFNLPFSKDMQDNLNDALAIAREPDSDVNNIYFVPGND
jgi:hypothetical protein